VEIFACDPESADGALLIEELSAALAAITGDSGKASFSPDGALFVVARGAEGELLGCGALRELEEGIGEIKRMYARPGTRGAGAALLAWLEREAVGLGYRELWLETRKVNTRAVDFYLKHGYEPIPNYGRYVGRPEAVCFAKTIEEAQ
jgi:GNAT superfamily N-acetyltransferase